MCETKSNARIRYLSYMITFLSYIQRRNQISEFSRIPGERDHQFSGERECCHDDTLRNAGDR